MTLPGYQSQSIKSPTQPNHEARKVSLIGVEYEERPYLAIYLMFSFSLKKLFKRGSGKGENTKNQTEKHNDNSDAQDGSSYTGLKVIQLQQKSRKLVGTLQRIVC